MFKRALYQIIFEDKEIFVGGYDYRETKWTQIPHDKKIKRIFYKLPTGDYLCLQDFSKIYHYPEATKDLSGENKGKVIIEFAYLLVKKENKILQYRISLLTGMVRLDTFNENDDYIQKLNPEGWRG